MNSIVKGSTSMNSIVKGSTSYVHDLCTYSVSLKGFYHGDPPPFSLAPSSFNLKGYSEKRCFTTLIEHCWPNVMYIYHWCTPPPLIFILGETLMKFTSNVSVITVCTCTCTCTCIMSLLLFLYSKKRSASLHDIRSHALLYRYVYN